MNFATWTNRVINESSEHYFAEELLEESIAKTLKPVVNKMKKLNIGVPYRDARLFFFNYLQDQHPEVIPAEFKDSKRKPSAKDVNAMVGQIAIDRPEMLDTFANEFEAYATGKDDVNPDEDRVSEFLRIAMILRTGKNVRPKKHEGYKTKEYSNLSAEEIKNTTMDAIEKAPIERGVDPDIGDEKLLLKVAFTKVLAQLSELDELDPKVLVNIADTGAKVDSIDKFKQFLDYMHQFEEYHLAEAYLRDMIAVLEREMASKEDEELDDFDTSRHSDEDIPDYEEDLHAMRSGKFPGMKKKRKVVDYDTSYAPVYDTEEDAQEKIDLMNAFDKGTDPEDKDTDEDKLIDKKLFGDVEDAEGVSVKQEVLNAVKQGAGEFAHKAAGMLQSAKELHDQYSRQGDQERASITKSLVNHFAVQSKFDEDAEAKPDYMDMDGDGDKEESMKKAAKDKHAACEDAEDGCTCGGCPDCADNARYGTEDNEQSIKDEYHLSPEQYEKARGMSDFDASEWFFSPSQKLYFRKREGGEDQEQSTAQYMSKAPVEKREESEEVRMSQQEINQMLATRERERVQNLYAQQRLHTQGY